MADLFTNGQITEVYFDMGHFENAANTPKFVKAPFNMIKIQPAAGQPFEDFMIPVSLGDNPKGLWSGATFRDEQYLGRQDFGWIAGGMVVSEHELGGFEANPDDWRGVFSMNMM